MTTPEKVTHREVREILRTFHESGWAAMTLELDGMRISVGKDGPPAAAAPGAAAVATPPPAPPVPAAPTAAAPPPPAPAAAVDTTGCVEVRSPAVGAFWVSPSPGEPPFVQVGQQVEANDQLAIVEVMKLMNPVVAPQAGEIVRVCATNAELVEFDQVLFLLRPNDG
ncbi:acetyl-CoA carboxylase biotin carboxyl carrier protein [Amycolatopsis thermophila]|uniref:Biotin carboxyl carrier protein of acetyl-CoA carboxylase n=1 Tax=Amycolatopsis thermophila TaxID=206084 RepID=A0ABU0F5U6_9PSEU|nr:biotin/lipoyl-containing protein [Amycolatopsis thermophila]MDQ0382964.1 acetyl-CoA carboxylase biotin carboxyl carrier protein [Amycolatopsis thermophila]